jgi:hypothetical protein
MQVATLTCVEVFSITEEVPLDPPDNPAFTLLCIEISKLVAWVSDEDASERLFDVLKISPRSELREAAKSARICSSNV